MLKYFIAALAGVAAGLIIALNSPLSLEKEPETPHPSNQQKTSCRDNVDALIRGLSAPNPVDRAIFHSNLVEETGVFFGFQPTALPEEREEVINRWKEWWAANRNKTCEQWLIDSLSLEEFKGKPLAIKKLAEMGSEKSIPALTALLESTQPDLRIDAARALGLLRAADALKRLISLLQSDPEPEVRRTAARALGQIGTKEAVAALSETANQDDALTKIEASSALLLKAPESALPVLHSLLTDDNEQARQFAISRITVLRNPESVPYLSKLLKGKKGFSKKAHDALKSIVGKDLGEDAGPWMEWYGKHKQQSKHNSM